MKKFAGVAFAILLFAMIAGGCGQSYEAEASTLFVLKDGKIISTDVEAFDENTYDKEGLTSYVEEVVEAYNSGCEGRNGNADSGICVRSGLCRV